MTKIAWVERRRLLIRCFRGGVLTTALINAPDPIEVETLINEEVAEPDGLELKLSPSGHVLRMLDMISAKEAGPWSLGDVRQSAPRKQVPLCEIEDGLRTLERHGIVKSVPSKRGTKWDLTGT